MKVSICLAGDSTWRRWAGLAYKSATGDPLFLMQNECDSSPFDHQAILMKDHFMRKPKLFELPIFLLSRTTCAFTMRWGSLMGMPRTLVVAKDVTMIYQKLGIYYVNLLCHPAWPSCLHCNVMGTP